MVAVEVIAEFGVVDELAVEQALDGLPPPLGRAGRPVLGLTRVLSADRGDQPVADGRLRRQ